MVKKIEAFSLYKNNDYRWLDEIASTHELLALLKSTLANPILPKNEAMRHLAFNTLFEVREYCLETLSDMKAYVFICLKYGRLLLTNTYSTNVEVLYDMQDYQYCVIALMYREPNSFEGFLRNPDEFMLAPLPNPEEEQVIQRFQNYFERAQSQHNDGVRESDTLAGSRATKYNKDGFKKFWTKIQETYWKYKRGDTLTDEEAIKKLMFLIEKIPPLQKPD